MPAGFQSFNPATGNFQIDGTYKNLAVVRSGSMLSTKVTGIDAGPSVYEVSIPISPSSGEILAVSCSSKICLYWNTNSTALFRVVGEVQVKYFVFNTNAPTANYGFQVLNPATQEVVFDATWKVFNVADIITSTGTVDYTAGREYAAIFLAQSARHKLEWQWIIPNNIYFVRRSYTTETIQMSGETVTVSLDEVSVVLSEATTPPDPPDPFNYSNGLSPRIMILDVTGY